MSHSLKGAVSSSVVFAERERPFWGFAEVFLVAAIFLPAVFAGATIMRWAATQMQIDPELGLPMLFAQFIGYGIVFLVLKALFTRYQEPLWASLGWVPQPFRPTTLAIAGFALALLMVLLGGVLQTPDVRTPFEKLLEDPVSRFGIAIFGISLGPVVEELLFRGFLQPVLVDAMGVLPGIGVTAVLFGGMHLMQNDFIWQSGLLITLVGFTLGVVRHISGSTRASAIVHVAYNSLPFIALLSSPVSRGR